MAEFQKNIDIFSILKDMLELNNMLVFNGSMYFDFRHQLLLGSALGEGVLLDDLGCGDGFGVLAHELVTLSKASLA